MAYAELRARSNGSFLDGASHPEEMVEAAHELGYAALALTDWCELGAIVRAHDTAKRLGVHLIVGAEIPCVEPQVGPVVLLAKNRQGYANLCRLLTMAKRSQPRGHPGLSSKQLLSASDGLIALLTQPCSPEWVKRYHNAYGESLALAVSRNYAPGEEAALSAARAWSETHRLPMVAVGNVRYHDALRKPLADVLTAIRCNVPLSACGYRLSANGEQHMKSPAEVADRFHAIDLQPAYEQTLRLAEQCSFSLDELRFVYPEKHLPAGETPESYFLGIVMHEAKKRYGDPIPPAVNQQLTHELDVIGRLRVEGFFLTMYDIVRFARSRGILCQGRGSAANSVVCFALGITSVEPVQAGLLFERFISEERGEPPDIDVDFEHERREEVIQFVYRRYGREHAGLVCENIAYRPRSAVRDVGKALGLLPSQVDRLAKGMPLRSLDTGLDETSLTQAGIDPDCAVVPLLRALVPSLLGFPRHRGTHVGGMVVTREPLVELAPLEDAAMPERTILPWDKDDCKQLGICKFDLLGLGMLTALRKSFELLSRHHGVQQSLATIPPDDAKTYERIRAAGTIGVFQIESRAQMGLLPRLKPRSFYDLVIAISIIRPGPIQGGMVHPFLRRRSGREPVTFPHPALRPILARTLGVPLFQEQVMRMAVTVAGFSPGEADELRRAMGAWRKRGTMGTIRERLVTGMRSQGISTPYALQIFEQIKGFGEYGFPESHAISFALLAYASAWLKTHYPEAFVTALLNSQPMGFYAPHTLVEDARRQGVVVLPIDVERSHWDCSLEPSPSDTDPPLRPAVRLGLRCVRGLGTSARDRYERARALGSFLTLEAFSRRTGFDRAVLSTLANAGAFQSLECGDLERRKALWSVLKPRSSEENLALVLDDDPMVDLLPMTSFEQVCADYAETGLSPIAHPVSFIRPELERRKMTSIQDLWNARNGCSVTVAGVVIGRQQPQTAKGMVFLSLEDETGLLNVVIPPGLFKEQWFEATRSVLLQVCGVLQRRHGSQSVKAKNLRALKFPKRSLRVYSRDFH